MRISFRTESDATRGITAEQNIRDFRLMSASRLVFTSPSLTRCAFDRHRGSGCPLTPATPPCVRVRTRRFEMVTLAHILQIRETERFEIGCGKRDGYDFHAPYRPRFIGPAQQLFPDGEPVLLQGSHPVGRRSSRRSRRYLCCPSPVVMPPTDFLAHILPP